MKNRASAQLQNAVRDAVRAVLPSAIDNPTTGWMELGADSLDLRSLAEAIDPLVSSNFTATRLLEFSTFA